GALLDRLARRELGKRRQPLADLRLCHLTGPHADEAVLASQLVVCDLTLHGASPLPNERLFSESSRTDARWQSAYLGPIVERLLEETSEERLEQLVGRDLHGGEIGRLLGTHEPHGVEPVVVVRPKAHGRGQP